MKLNTAENDTSSYDISDNFFEDFVTFSRSNMLQNERQAMVVQMVVASSYLDDWRHYNSAIVTGSSSSGKTHMLREVTTRSLEYAEAARDGPWLYELTGGSDKAAIDDDEMDEAMAAYLHEMNKIPDEFLEFIKSVSEDGGFKYGRNVADDDSDSGRTTVHIEKDPIPVLFAFADENEDESGDDQELRSRLVEVKVDEGREKNRAVHLSTWGERRITMPDTSGEYIFDAPDVSHRVKSHMRDIPTDINVVFPVNDNRFPGDDWHAGEVSAPMFTFKRAVSTRASAYIGNLFRGSTVLNYHDRDTWCDECESYVEQATAEASGYECDCGGDLRLIATPQDLGNVIDCREILLATTHNLTTKKFAVIDGILENGGPATTFENVSHNAVMATKPDIIEYIQAADDIPTLSKHEIGQLLDELNEQLVVQKRDHPDDARKNVYVFDGAEMFQRPDIDAFPDHFGDVTSPVTGEPIADVVDRQLQQFNAGLDTDMDTISTAADAMGSSRADGDSHQSDAAGDLSDFDSPDDPDASELSEAAQIVCERLQDTLHGKSAPIDARDDIDLAHMVGVAPLKETDAGHVVPEREVRGDDKADSILAPDAWDDEMSFDEVEQHVADAVRELQTEGVFEIRESGGAVSDDSDGTDSAESEDTVSFHVDC
jgi:hypothetical protein